MGSVKVFCSGLKISIHCLNHKTDKRHLYFIRNKKILEQPGSSRSFMTLVALTDAKFYFHYVDTIKLHLIQKDSIKVIDIPAILQDKFC